MKVLEFDITLADCSFVSHPEAAGFVSIQMDNEVSFNELPFRFDEAGKVVLLIPSNNCIPSEPAFSFIEPELSAIICGYISKVYHRTLAERKRKEKEGAFCEER